MRVPRLLIVLAGSAIVAVGALQLRPAHSDRTEVLGEVIERPSTTTAPVPAAPTTVTTAAPPATPPATAAAPQPAPALDPAPARLEVRFPVPEGTVTVTAEGPGGTSSASPIDGVAVFDGLAPGTYQLTITSESDPAPPSADGTNIGTALSTHREGPYEIGAGSVAVVTCSSSACERTA